MKNRPQVLVIDDDAVVGRSFDRVLSGKGYEVDTALNGEEALKDIGHTDYDVVFTDIKMPGMDGLEVAERIRERCPWTPVVVITGYGTEENEARASVLGVSGFIHKPLTPEIIESITLKALQKPALAGEAANEPAEARSVHRAGLRDCAARGGLLSVRETGHRGVPEEAPGSLNVSNRRLGRPDKMMNFLMTKRSTTLPFALFATVLLLIAAAAAQANEYPSASDSKCIKCHSRALKKSLEDGGQLSLQVTAAHFEPLAAPAVIETSPRSSIPNRKR
jgi:CheY-like chemotaxis protein